MFRKKRQPAPFFRMPGAPFNPATGENALLGAYPSKGTTLSLFQVIGDDPNDPDTADTHNNYVVCRGYEADHDPNFRFLHDPFTTTGTTPINVAKPYSVRGTFPYQQGQVIVAARIKGKLGHNAGKAETTIGQPADLSEEVVLLTDDAGAGIAWLDVGTQQDRFDRRDIFLPIDFIADTNVLAATSWGAASEFSPYHMMLTQMEGQDNLGGELWRISSTGKYEKLLTQVGGANQFTLYNPYPWQMGYGYPLLVDQIGPTSWVINNYYRRRMGLAAASATDFLTGPSPGLNGYMTNWNYPGTAPAGIYAGLVNANNGIFDLYDGSSPPDPKDIKCAFTAEVAFQIRGTVHVEYDAVGTFGAGVMGRVTASLLHNLNGVESAIDHQDHIVPLNPTTSGQVDFKFFAQELLGGASSLVRVTVTSEVPTFGFPNNHLTGSAICHLALEPVGISQ